MFSLWLGLVLFAGVVGYKAGVYYQAYKYSKKKPKVPPFDKVVRLDMYKKYYRTK